jgi:hypothetical protein
MVRNKAESNNFQDRIEGDKIILIDPHQSGGQVLKKIEIITADGRKRKYKLKRTARGKYLLN